VLFRGRRRFIISQKRKAKKGRERGRTISGHGPSFQEGGEKKKVGLNPLMSYCRSQKEGVDLEGGGEKKKERRGKNSFPLMKPRRGENVSGVTIRLFVAG